MILLLLGVLLLIPFALLGGWVTMLCLGALAHIFVAPALAVAFWPSVIVSLIISILFNHASHK